MFLWSMRQDSILTVTATTHLDLDRFDTSRYEKPRTLKTRFFILVVRIHYEGSVHLEEERLIQNGGPGVSQEIVSLGCPLRRTENRP